ncbi:hypothetical protein ACIQPS_04660 [Streptomyces sp. NPDC091290]|uniref:hypothetical protein n=1 Tax=Streptomyces TaxID=1883 RepID=UPI000A3C8E5E|nr:hypothetical protein [Streptomyces viridochromogenes]
MNSILTKWSRNTKRALMGISATAAALTLSAAPAFAGSNLHQRSYSEDCGILGCITIEHADGYFYHDGDHWKVCDNYPDGDRAVLTVFWSDSTGDYQLKIQDTNGSGNSCAEGHRNLREGQKVVVRTWHQNGANGSEKDARRGEATA